MGIDVASIREYRKMAFNLILLLTIISRCLGQQNPCEGISLGSCDVEPDSIIKTYTATPDRCSKLSEMNDNCEYWRAQWDGQLCHLLSSDYQHDCESFAGAINWLDCTEGPESCYAIVEDDCVYEGDQAEEDEPTPGDVASIKACQEWAQFWDVDGVAFFHYDSTSEECHLYRNLSATCSSVGAPKSAPSWEECTATTTPVPTTTASISCADGWTESGRSCYFLSTDYIRPFASAAKFCEDLGSTLVEINTEEENAFVVAMVEEAAAADNNVGRDYWIGGVRGEDGTWRWQSGDPMDYTNWNGGCPDDCQPDDRPDWRYTQLLKTGYPGTFDTYYWVLDHGDGTGDDGVICEISFDK